MRTQLGLGYCALLLMLWTLPVLSQTDDVPVGIVRKMHAIAGENPLDCGHVPPEADPKASLKCARKAIRRRQSFVVQYDTNGIEGTLFTIFAGDGKGDVYWLHVDSYTCQFPDRYPDKCPYVVECPKPIRLFYFLDTTGKPYDYDCVEPTWLKKRD